MIIIGGLFLCLSKMAPSGSLNLSVSFASMLNYAGDAGDGFIQDAAAAYPLIGLGGRRN